MSWGNKKDKLKGMKKKRRSSSSSNISDRDRNPAYFNNAVDDFVDQRHTLNLNQGMSDDSCSSSEKLYMDLDVKGEVSSGSSSEDAGLDMSIPLELRRTLRGDDMDDAELEDDDEDDGDWGTRKRAYYQQEASASYSEEEKEALRLQRDRATKLTAADFLGGDNWADGDDDDDDDDDDDAVETNIVHPSSQNVEELEQVVSDLKVKLAEIRDTLQPLLKRAQSGDLMVPEGVSFLELKYQLLLSYCLNLTFYLLLRAEGHKVEDHPVVGELVRLRVVMEKIRPLDERIKGQVTRLLRAATLGDSAASDPSLMRARPESLMAPAGSQPVHGQEEAGAAYRPPKIAPMYFDQQERKADKAARKLERERKRAAQSEIFAMVRDEYGEEPEEQPATLSVIEGPNQADLEREAFEEDNFVRLQMTKKDRQRKKDRRYVNELAELDDFGDMDKVLRATEGQADDEEGSRPSVLKEGSLAQYLRAAQERGLVEDQEEDQEAAELQQQKRRRVKFDKDAYAEYEQLEEEYEQRKKKDKYSSNPNAFRPADEEEAEAKRQIGYQIAKNRGMLISRKNSIARVRNRKKYEKGMKRRTAQVKSVRKEFTKYDGEATGISKNLARGRKLN